MLSVEACSLMGQGGIGGLAAAPVLACLEVCFWAAFCFFWMACARSVPLSSATCMSLAVGLNLTLIGSNTCWKPESCGHMNTVLLFYVPTVWIALMAM